MVKEMMGTSMCGQKGCIFSIHLEGLELCFWLGHVRVKVREVTKILSGLLSSVRISRVKAFVVLNEAHHAVLLGDFRKIQVVSERLGCRLGDEHVDPFAHGVDGDRVVRRVWREDGDCVALLQGIDCGLV